MKRRMTNTKNSSSRGLTMKFWNITLTLLRIVGYLCAMVLALALVLIGGFCTLG